MTPLLHGRLTFLRLTFRVRQNGEPHVLACAKRLLMTFSLLELLLLEINYFPKKINQPRIIGCVFLCSCVCVCWPVCPVASTLCRPQTHLSQCLQDVQLGAVAGRVRAVVSTTQARAFICVKGWFCFWSLFLLFPLQQSRGLSMCETMISKLLYSVMSWRSCSSNHLYACARTASGSVHVVAFAFYLSDELLNTEWHYLM